MTILSRASSVVAIAALMLALDQVSKWFILDVVMDPPRTIEIAPFFNLRLGFNRGMSFGMFSETLERSPELFALFKLIVAIGLAVWAFMSNNRLERYGLAMIAGGAVGNALDRWRQGAVTDFLDFYWGNWHWPTFNGADIAISAGVGLILLAAALGDKAAPARDPSGAEQRR
jgi:signal peptidase II